MRFHAFFHLCVLCCCLLSRAGAASMDGQDELVPAFTTQMLRDNLEGGSSLVIVKILSQNPPHKDPKIGGIFYYRVQLIRSVVDGDFKFHALKKPFDIEAGSFGDELHIGSLYALFVIKSGTCVAWNRTAFIEIAPDDRRRIGEINRQAQQFYRDSDIRRFRRAKLQSKPTLPPLSPDILAACRQVKTQPGNCAAAALTIYKSPLGSRSGPEAFASSIGRFFPPSLALNREQIVFLLGKPTLKIGRSYTWFCGEAKNIPRRPEQKEFYLGLLSVSFDHNEKVASLTFGGVEQNGRGW